MDIAISTFLNPSGLSVVGQDYFRCFSSMGIRCVPIWLAPPEMTNSLDATLVEEMITSANRPYEESPIQFHAGRADDIRVLKEKTAIIGSIVLEGNRLLSEQIRICKALDAVATPSYFCRNVCVSSGIPREKIFHLPYALDSKTWHPGVIASQPKGQRFRFLFMNTAYERKGLDILLKAYWQEFSADDPVELVIKSYRENDRTDPLDVLLAIEAARNGVNRDNRAPITTFDSVMDAKDIPSFMKGFDAYVSPHRSEGFGLNPWHAMALGVPVICTNYGGNTDFTKAETSWLVKIERYTKPSAKEAMLFRHLRDTTWAEPDIQDLRKQMRLCATFPNEAKRRAEKGAKMVASNYSFEKVGQAFEQILKKVAPGSWERLCVSKHIELIAKQPSERFESIEKPLKMIEI